MKYTCDIGHTNLWTSGPKITHKKKRVAKINITLAGYIFLGGLQFKVFKVGLGEGGLQCNFWEQFLMYLSSQELSIRLGLLMFSSSTYYRYLRDVVRF